MCMVKQVFKIINLDKATEAHFITPGPSLWKYEEREREREAELLVIEIVKNCIP